MIIAEFKSVASIQQIDSKTEGQFYCAQSKSRQNLIMRGEENFVLNLSQIVTDDCNLEMLRQFHLRKKYNVTVILEEI